MAAQTGVLAAAGTRPVTGGKGAQYRDGLPFGGQPDALFAAGMKGEDVEFPAGTPLIIKLDQPLTISVNP
jgi:hypothetical protein